MDEELKKEEQELEFKRYEESGSEDDFNTWKLKKYVDHKFNQLFLTVFIAFIVILLFNYFF